MELDGVAGEQPGDLVLILCGQCGAGKSATANTLCGKLSFHSMRSAAAVTMECLSAETSTARGTTVHVLDTPGLSDPESSEEEIHAKIVASVAAMAEAHPEAQFAVALIVSLAGRADDNVLEGFRRLGLVFGGNLQISCRTVYCQTWSAHLLSPRDADLNTFSGGSR